MAYDTEHKSAADLQRDVEAQRNRVESTIDQIQQKLSPGQLVDELLAYTKGGGGEFVASLQRNVTANPLPVAMLGISLAWLMAKPVSAAGDNSTDRKWDESINANRGYGADDRDDDYPFATIHGSSMRRVGSITDEGGQSFSEFADEGGRKFKALTDKSGQRAGHFIDEAGQTFRGFTDATGQRVDQFRDEAGNLLDEVSGWASHTWQKAREKLHDARDAVHTGTDTVGSRATAGGHALRDQVGTLNETLVTQFRDQPLVGGALAFALGAALGTALPHTRQEDALIGEAADAVKAKAGEQAGELYEQGKEKATDLYEAASEKAGELYQQAKDGLAQAGEEARESSPRDGRNM